MSIAFQCERCGKDFQVGSEWAGRRCKCKKCGHEFAIPGERPAVKSRSAAPSRPANGAAGPRAPRSTSGQTAAQAFARDGDPYSIGDDDDLWAKQPVSQEPDLGELLPQRPRPSTSPKKKKKSRRAKSSRSNSDNESFPSWVFLVGLCFGFVMARQMWLRKPADVNPAWVGLAFVIYTASLSGGLALLVIAFREGVRYGLCCLLIPFYALYYAFTRRGCAQEAFALSFVGSITISGMSVANPQLFKARGNQGPPQIAGHPMMNGQVPPFDHPPRFVLPPNVRVDLSKPLPPRPPEPPREIHADFTDQALADLKSPTVHLREQALNRLKNAPPNDRRAEVAKAVEPGLSDPNTFYRCNTAQVLGVWGGPENIPALLNGLKDPAFNVRWAVLDALKVRHDPTSAEALVDYLMNSDDRGKAADALKAIGPEAEDAVLRSLGHHNDFTRMDTCKILEEIGTVKSVVPLQKLLRSRQGQGLDSMAARDALKQIAWRNSR